MKFLTRLFARWIPKESEAQARTVQKHPEYLGVSIAKTMEGLGRR